MDQKITAAIALFDKLTNCVIGADSLVGVGFVNGEWIGTEGAVSGYVYNPATGSIIGNYYETAREKIREAFKAAHLAHFRWHHLVKSQEKRAVFKRLLELLLKHEEELAALFTCEGGKIISNSRADVVESRDTIEAAHNTLHDEAGTMWPAQVSNKFAGTIA